MNTTSSLVVFIYLYRPYPTTEVIVDCSLFQGFNPAFISPLCDFLSMGCFSLFSIFSLKGEDWLVLQCPSHGKLFETRHGLRFRNLAGSHANAQFKRAPAIIRKYLGMSLDFGFLIECFRFVLVIVAELKSVC